MVLNETKKLRLLLILGLIIHIIFISFLWGVQRNNINLNSKLSFDEDIKDDNNVLISYLESYNHVLYGLRGFVTSSEKITQEEWNLYTKSLNITDAYPGLKTLFYLPYIPHNSKNTFINNLKNDYKNIASNISFNLEWENRTAYFPVQYTYPFEETKLIIGQDYMQSTNISRAINDSIDKGIATATVTKEIEQTLPKEVDYLVFLPIYNKYQVLDTLEQRQNQIFGIVGLSLDIDELVAKSYTSFKNNRQVYLEVFDVTDNLLPNKIVVAGNSEIAKENKGFDVYSISLGGRNLEFKFKAEEYYRTNIVLIRNTDIFFTIVLLLGIVALILTYRIISIKRLKTQYSI